jgi:hypothetical protein
MLKIAMLAVALTAAPSGYDDYTYSDTPQYHSEGDAHSYDGGYYNTKPKYDDYMSSGGFTKPGYDDAVYGSDIKEGPPYDFTDSPIRESPDKK